MSSIIVLQLMRRTILPALHRIRPPNAIKPFPAPVSTSRLFTTRQPLVLLRALTRPQRPLLELRSLQPRSGSPQLARLSTAAKTNIKYQLRLGLYWATIAWILALSWVAGQFILRQDWLERQYPTPSDWNWYIRVLFHEARQEDLTEGWGSGMVDWARTGSRYRGCLTLCETLKKASKGLKEQEEGGIDIPGAGKVGLDITEKSEPWRRGYYQVLMGCAKAAEQLEGWVVDKTRSKAFRVEEVIGPSNPHPRRVLPGSPPAPLEENCEPAFETPESYYIKILTTKGFTTKQRMDASLAYASWLGFKGLNDTAMEMYKWALDIACSTLDDPASVVNRKTGVIQPKATTVSSNVLAVSTAIASHFARNDEIPAALNTYLSILRARRAADTLPPKLDQEKADPDFSLGSPESLVKFLLAVPFPADYPPAPPSGDEPFMRTRKGKCEEAAIMTYVGEILFASKAEQDGLSWTRDAVAMAEEGLEETSGITARTKMCNECLQTGLENWQKMVRRLAAKETEQNSSSGSQLPKKLKTALKGGSGSQAGVAQEAQQSVWQQEDRKVSEKLEQYYAKMLDERLRASVVRAGRFNII